MNNFNNASEKSDNNMLADHAEAQRLLDKGFKLCALQPMSKRPVGDEWQKYPVTSIDPHAGGHGMPLALNGLCSIDPDNVEPAREGLLRCGFSLEDLMSAGVRTTSTRPGSGGRSTFLAAVGLRWLKFSSRSHGTILELRAASTNLQDCLPGTTYRAASGEGPYVQQYANGRKFDEAPDLPQSFLAWWLRMSEDVEFLRAQQRLLCGPDAMLAISSGDRKLAYKSHLRVTFNEALKVPEILERHQYTTDGHGRWAPRTATGAPCVRPIPGRIGLWQSDHASDPLHGTFDAWTAYVTLDHDGDLSAAEAAWEPTHHAALVADFEVSDQPPDERKQLPAFKRTSTGDILATKENTVRALGRPDMTGFQVRHDSFRGEVMLAEHQSEGWRSFKDTDYMELAMRLERARFQNLKKDLMRDAVDYVANRDSFDSAQHWLNQKEWDGVPRVEQFLVSYFAAQDTPYIRAVGLYLWTALAGRVIEPAVKCDMVPVAVGGQGTRKSSAVAALVPSDDFFTSIDLSNRDDDLARLMRGKLVIELGELKGLSTRDAEHIKAFITRRHEEWTPKYREMTVRYARRCVFFGTSNKDDFLGDETGNRRWLPFTSGTCDPVGIERDRELLWAEARELFIKKGVLHHDAERLAAAEHANFAVHDEWESAVQEWLHKPVNYIGEPPCSLEHLTSRQVLKGAINLLDAQMTQLHQKRMKGVLTRLGYRYGTVRINGVKARVFLKPWAV